MMKFRLKRFAPWCILPVLINIIMLFTKKPKEIVVYLDALFVFVPRYLIPSHGSRYHSYLIKTKLQDSLPGEGVWRQVTSKSTTCSSQMELMPAFGQITQKAARFG